VAWLRASRIKLKLNVRAARRKCNDADLMAPGKRGRKGGRGRRRKEGSPPPQKETPKLADVCKCFFACGACGACVVVMRICLFKGNARGVPMCSLQQEHQQHQQQQGEQQQEEQVQYQRRQLQQN